MKSLGAIATLLVVLQGCCSCGSEAPAPASALAPSPDDDAPAPACLGLCERIAACDRDEAREPAQIDCVHGCEAGGVYAALDAAALACADRRTCAEVRECAGPGLAVALLGSFAAASAPLGAPAGWPEGLPMLAGGLARPAPQLGPVRVALVAYAGRDVEATDRDYRATLTEAGWVLADAAQPGETAHRFVATHESSSVSVSIYRDGADAVIQTMMLESPPAPGTP